jgi:hypothetical protein
MESFLLCRTYARRLELWIANYQFEYISREILMFMSVPAGTGGISLSLSLLFNELNREKQRQIFNLREPLKCHGDTRVRENFCDDFQFFTKHTLSSGALLFAKRAKRRKSHQKSTIKAACSDMAKCEVHAYVISASVHPSTPDTRKRIIIYHRMMFYECVLCGGGEGMTRSGRSQSFSP